LQTKKFSGSIVDKNQNLDTGRTGSNYNSSAERKVEIIEEEEDNKKSEIEYKTEKELL